MGFMKGLFGGSPKVQTDAVDELEKSEERKKKARTQLLETQQGLLGEEVIAGETSTRKSLLGN